LNLLPDPQISSTATAFCTGSTIMLTGSPASGVTYQWYFNNSPISGETNAVYNAGQAGDYQLYVNDGVCDSISVATNITENLLPGVIVNSPSYCLNATSQLAAGGAQTYTWSAGTSPATGANVSVPTTAAGTTTYTVTGTDINGCVNTATSTVIVNANPVIQINGLQNGAITACSNASTVL